jgi:hypothetical protein
MRHIANATYMSLDGVVQHPELWTFDYRSDDAARVSHEQLWRLSTRRWPPPRRWAVS